MKSDKVCIDKRISFLAIGVLLVVGFIVAASFVGKTKTSSNTRAAAPMDDSKKCNPYGSVLVTETSGRCWSLGSKATIRSRSFPGSDGVVTPTPVLYQVCENEIVTDRKTQLNCPTPAYARIADTNLTEVYSPLFDSSHYSETAMCYGTGINLYGTPEMPSSSNYPGLTYNYFLNESSVDLNQCNLKTYNCNNSSYKIVEGKCFKLRGRKCTVTRQYVYPACCSDEVPMTNCAPKQSKGYL